MADQHFRGLPLYESAYSQFYQESTSPKFWMKTLIEEHEVELAMANIDQISRETGARISVFGNEIHFTGTADEIVLAEERLMPIVRPQHANQAQAEAVPDAGVMPAPQQPAPDPVADEAVPDVNVIPDPHEPAPDPVADEAVLDVNAIPVGEEVVQPNPNLAPQTFVIPIYTYTSVVDTGAGVLFSLGPLQGHIVWMECGGLPSPAYFIYWPYPVFQTMVLNPPSGLNGAIYYSPPHFQGYAVWAWSLNGNPMPGYPQGYPAGQNILEYPIHHPVSFFFFG